MTTKRRSKRGNQIPLIIESHPDDYQGYPFITLIQYHDKHILSIIDNATAKSVKAFVLDLCGPERISEEAIISVAQHWYETSEGKYPISFEFSKLGITNEMSKILRTYNIDFITRIIGPLPKFEMSAVKSVKRRRRKSIPNGIQIKKKVTQLR